MVAKHFWELKVTRQLDPSKSYKWLMQRKKVILYPMKREVIQDQILMRVKGRYMMKWQLRLYAWKLQQNYMSPRARRFKNFPEFVRRPRQPILVYPSLVEHMTFLRLSRKKMLWRMGPLGKAIRFFKQPYTMAKRAQVRIAHSVIQRVNSQG